MEKLQGKVTEQASLIQSLRKKFLKEINNLRDAHNQGAEKFKDALHVQFFDVTEGID